MENILSKIGLGPKKDLVPVVRDNDALYVYVKCDRCKEVIPVRISRKEEIQENYDKDKEKTYQYYVRKEVSGSGKNRCFARVGIYLEFDSQYRATRAEINGGSFVSKSEYTASRDEK
ncbi:MAG: hypothetical protein ACOX29_04905 [Bacillota bacterium]|nr:hypothetical protein [Bacillota bacterium]NLU54039.1 hypothetical protein [Bacillota bacterium]HPQ11108.1 hypothetical protein [Bacillota bacterium]HPT61390.1 hypothetical protein [Bacillota bacterium]